MRNARLFHFLCCQHPKCVAQSHCQHPNKIAGVVEESSTNMGKAGQQSSSSGVPHVLNESEGWSEEKRMSIYYGIH